MLYYYWSLRTSLELVWTRHQTVGFRQRSRALLECLWFHSNVDSPMSGLCPCRLWRCVYVLCTVLCTMYLPLHSVDTPLAPRSNTPVYTYGVNLLEVCVNLPKLNICTTCLLLTMTFLLHQSYCGYDQSLLYGSNLNLMCHLIGN